MAINYDPLPEPLRDGAQRYIEHGVLPGSFLRAVIANDLFEAMGRADDFNRHRIHAICAWFYNHAPAGSFGSPDNMKEWHEKGGILGGVPA